MSSGNLKKNLCFDPLVSLNPSKEKYYYLQSISFFNVRDYVITRVFENLIKRLKKKKNRKKIERVMDFYGISSISALSKLSIRTIVSIHHYHKTREKKSIF